MLARIIIVKYISVANRQPLEREIAGEYDVDAYRTLFVLLSLNLKNIVAEE